MAKAGEIVVVDFPGAQGTKRRPAMIVSSDAYHSTRPDMIIGLITSQVSSATGPTDCLLLDWKSGGLRVPSAFRAYLVTLPRTAITASIGMVSARDWQAISDCVKTAIAK